MKQLNRHVRIKKMHPYLQIMFVQSSEVLEWKGRTIETKEEYFGTVLSPS
jgi:hypothetical protein